MRTYRKTAGRTTRTLGALGLTAAALLAATACGPTDDDSTGPTLPPSTSAATSAATSPSSPAPGRPGEAEGDPVGRNGNCSDEYAQVTVEWAVPPTKDDSKLLLTVVNKGTKPCKLTSYPVLRLGDGHGRLVDVIASSRPKDPVVLAPGKEAYAGLLARTSNKDVSTLTKNLALAPHGQSPNDDTGEGTLLQLPAGGVYMDDKARVTYWQSTSENAASPLFPH